MCGDDRWWNLSVNLFLMFLFGAFGNVVWAEPQFGGDVSGVIACTCGDNAGGHYFVVSDPHGDENGGPASYVSGPNTDVRDCPPIADGEEILGMHNENDEECKIRVYNACVTVGSGKGVDMYGTSPNNCGSHKTSASSSVVDDIKQRRDNGEEVVGSGTTNSSEKTDKSENVVKKIKQKRDSEDNEIKSSEDIDNPEATDLSKNVVKQIVQKRDNKEKVRGTKAVSILNNIGAQIGPDGEIAVLGSRDEIVEQKKDEVLGKSLLKPSNKKDNIKNDSWRIMVALVGFGLGSYFIGRAGRKIAKGPK